MIPKLLDLSDNTLDPFGTMLNRMVPKLLTNPNSGNMNLWHHVKQNGSKTSLLLFNMIGVDQNRFLGVKQIKSAIAFLANVP